MADRTNMDGVAVSSGYVQHLITAIDNGVPATSQSPSTSIVYSANNRQIKWNNWLDKFTIGE